MSEIPMEIENSAVSIFKPTEDISPIVLQSNVQLNGTAPSEIVSPQLFVDNSSKLISEPTESSINTDGMGLPENEDPPTETLPSNDSSADKSSISEPQATTQISYCNGAIEPVSTVGNIITKADKEDSNLDSNLIDNNNDQNSMDVPPSDDNDDGVKNCYCGKRRNLNLVELQCAGCYKWFHDTCITFDIGKCVPFMTYYTFFCKTCSPSGSETFFKKQPNFSQMCATAIANLTQQSSMDGELKTMFSKDKDVIPYIESNWEYLTSMPRRVKQTWHLTVYKAMLKDNDLFVCDERRDESFPMEQPTFGLANQDLYKIGPCYESSMRSMQKQAQEVSQPVSGFSSGKGRSAKRRFVGDGQMAGGGKKIKSDLVMPKLPPNGYPLEHPFNKDGYRYILAEPDPHAPCRREFDESQDWAGKPIPSWLYRRLTPNNVLVALHDRAPQLKISEDRLSVTGDKGYCMTRATHGISRGTWYFEITIDEMNDNSATRLGWSQGLGNLQAPLGYDKFSYAWRSRKGTKFHESRGYHYSNGSYSQGDVLGFLLHLPATYEETTPLPPVFKDKPLVKFKSYLYYEEKDETQLELKRLKPLPGSKIVFYKNGESMGTAFENIYAGTYYPAASLYKNCTINFNFGPDFKCPPAGAFKGIHEVAQETIIEQTMTDLLYFTENKGKLRLDNTL